MDDYAGKKERMSPTVTVSPENRLEREAFPDNLICLQIISSL